MFAEKSAVQARSQTTADHELVRRLNTATILDCLRLDSSLSRAGLSGRTGLNRSTVSSIVAELIDKGLVRETMLQKDKVGRPGMALELDPNGGSAIGVAIAVDTVAVVLVDFLARPLWQARRGLEPQAGLDAILATAESLVDAALHKAAKPRPLGIGVGVPSLVDQQAGEVKITPNLHWRNVPIRERWTDRFGLPIFVENEARAAALGEYYFGAARHVKDFIYLSAGAGLGAGIMIGGALLRGRGRYAGEVGHMTIDPNGRLCNCGRRGCWEMYVSSRAVIRQLYDALASGAASRLRELAGTRQLTFDDILDAALHGDTTARSAFEGVAHWLGVGIANLVQVFDPELVVLGGELARANAIWLPDVRSAVRTQTLTQPAEQLVIAAAHHGDNACMIGTATLVLDDILRAPALHR
jgi:glucokinase-like ROK family protein